MPTQLQVTQIPAEQNSNWSEHSVLVWTQTGEGGFPQWYKVIYLASFSLSAKLWSSSKNLEMKPTH